jgi:SNF2 family DNA or RNA helicase
LKKVGWGAVIIDEAQQIKNVASSQTKAIKQLKAPIKIALSGTPVENKLSELWSIFDFVLPGFLGTIKQFKKVYSKPIEADNDEAALARLRMLTGPFLLRRLKTDPEIGKELPEKLVTDHVCSLQPEQAALYQTVVDEVAQELAAREEGEKSGRSAVVLKMISDLKQICNHPHNFSPNKYGPDTSLSGKCELLSEIIDPVLKSGEQILIFTQYVKMLSTLVEHVIPENHNVKPLAYHGGMSVNARDAAVKRFQNGDVPIMVVSLKAGGVGLNLTAANHVALFDLWYVIALNLYASRQRQVLLTNGTSLACPF